MNIVVTGATGLVGSRLLQLLVNSLELRNHTFHSFQRPSSVANSPYHSLVFSSIHYGDCSNVTHIIDCLADTRPDLIVHLAQSRFVPQLLNAIEQLVISPYLIVLGSTGVFSRFDDCSAPYVKAEASIQRYLFGFTYLRSTLIYGSRRDRNIHKLYNLISSGLPVCLPYGGRSLFQPIYYSDVSFAIYTSMLHFCLSDLDSLQGFFNICGPDQSSLLSICGLISDLSGSRLRILDIPVNLLSRLLRLSEFTGIRLPVTSEQLLRLREDKIYRSDWNLLFPSIPQVTLPRGLLSYITTLESI
ncbi:hypothetical protein CWE17_07165 [Synechococcus sp. BS56D]|uniref:NAD-dependent epimerase/dehydratase family protein n=1 Tax=Synechococcus sp. BS56D TaxID=2055944 RepID=UPI001038EE25|nr:NAD-dependent epimerase/dehydratase family protein [Synechococcus sp. BS56D]TCD57616.1 hypothetical protein CWE17_07165 [Synechococcus sp. BS56D]